MSYIPNPHPRLAELAPNGQQKVDFLAWFNGGLVIDDAHLLAGRPDQVTIKLLPEALTQRLIVPKNGIIHSQAGANRATNLQLWTHMAKPTVNIEPHVIGPEFVTGKIIQCVPFNRAAHCNADANEWFEGGARRGALSMETQDNGNGNGNPSHPNHDRLRTTQWDLAQFGMIASIMTAWCATYRLKCWMPFEWDVSGMGYHSLHKEWSVHIGKSCPGKARIGQFPELLNHVASRLAHYYDAVGETRP